MHLKDHKKHAALERPHYGAFGRNEWAFVGGRCGTIKELAGRIIAALPQYRSAYADARHEKEGEALQLPGQLPHGAQLDYSYEAAYHQLQFLGELNDFQKRSVFSAVDLVLVNGNHFEAAAQVVILDPAKKESLRKRWSQLKNIQLVLRTEAGLSPADFLPEGLSPDIPVYDIDEQEKINKFFYDQMRAAEPPLKGLVLAGGRSRRLGHDKTTIAWHGKEQRYYLADLLRTHCPDTYISCRADQANDIDGQYPFLTDTFLELGPYSALLSAFRAAPNAAWLVVASDLPLFRRASLQQLVAGRRPSACATAFASPRDGSPEPLAAIWEPKSYPLLLSFLSQGVSCPRKVLLNTPTHLLTPHLPSALTNVNTIDDEARARASLSLDPDAECQF